MNQTVAPPAISPRQVTAAVVGNALEFYDFTTFAYFAVQIGHAFFPNHSTFISLVAALATYGIGFVPRPLGALVFGHYADRHGRRPAMLISFAMMGAGVLGLTLTPSYAAIGPLAPTMVVFWRLCQGFALGGEVGPTTAFLVESAPPGSRGRYAAWQGGSQNLAAIAAGLIGLALSAVLGSANLDAWGWRLAFGIGVLILPIGLILRRNLPETLHHPEEVSQHQPALATLSAHRRIIFIGLALVAAATVSTYAMTYMTTYARETLKMGAGISLAAPLVNGAAGLIFGLIGGALSDRLGRRAMLIWPRLVFLTALWPIFYLMDRNRDGTTLLIGIAVLAAASALSSAAMFTALAESLRKEVRGIVLGGVISIGVAVFGGTTQLIIATLIQVTHNPLSPAWYAMGFTAVGLVASVLIKETAPERKPASPLLDSRYGGGTLDTDHHGSRP